MAKTPNNKGGYVRVGSLDEDEDEGGVASIQAHWRKHFGWLARLAYSWVSHDLERNNRCVC